MLPELTSRLLREWPAVFGNHRRPVSIDYLGLPGAVEGGTTTFIGFSAGEWRPLFVVKVHRDADAGPRAENERTILDHLHAHAAEIEPSLPRVVFCDRVGGCWVIVETVIDGRPMGITLEASGLPVLREADTNLRRASEWLTGLHRVQPPVVAGRETPETVAVRRIDDFTAAFHPSAVERALLKDITAELAGAVGSSFSVTHGDFCRHNLLVSTETATLGVIDWTDSAAAGFALHDLLFFASTYFVQVRRKTGLDGIKDVFFETFFGDSAYAAAVRESVDACCLRLAVSRSLRIQLGLFLVFQTLRELEKLERLARTSGAARITLWLAGEVGSDYDEARRASFWLYLFKDLARRAA